MGDGKLHVNTHGPLQCNPRPDLLYSPLPLGAKVIGQQRLGKLHVNTHGQLQCNPRLNLLYSPLPLGTEVIGQQRLGKLAEVHLEAAGEGVGIVPG